MCVHAKSQNGLVEAYIQTDARLATEEGARELTDIHTMMAPTSPGPGSAASFFMGSPIDSTGRLRANSIGCTAVCALVKSGRLYVANAGDSRCILSRAGRAVEMTTDHKPELPEEARRIMEAGGFVSNGRVNGNLNLTRAIGDQDYKRDRSLPPSKQIITCVPDVTEEQLAEDDEFIVLACDGIWDCMSNQQVVNFIRRRLLARPTPEEDATVADPELIDDGSRLDEERVAATGIPLAQAHAEAPWPGEYATSVPELCREISALAIDMCLSPNQASGIGCDNMSLTLVLFLNSKLGKQVVKHVAEVAAKHSQKSPSAAGCAQPPTPSAATQSQPSASAEAAAALSALEHVDTPIQGQDETDDVADTDSKKEREKTEVLKEDDEGAEKDLATINEPAGDSVAPTTVAVTVAADDESPKQPEPEPVVATAAAGSK